MLRLGEVLLVTLQGDLHDSTAQQLQEDLAETIVRSGATGVVIDVSGVEIVDSFLGRIGVEAFARTFGERPDWGFVLGDLAVCAAVGVISLAVATWAYRRAAVR